MRNHIPYLSMPQAIDKLFLEGRKSIVIAGTHGKSTTASLLTWVLSEAHLDPCAFVGAFMNNWGQSYRMGAGDYMVLEGDEYDTAFFDKVPKFVHYRPHIGVITSIEYDHADIYPDFQAVIRAFERFVGLIPSSGCLIVNADDPHCLALSRQCAGRIITYGRAPHADWRLLEIDYLPGKVRARYLNPDEGTRETLLSEMPGLHNICNALAVKVVSDSIGISHQTVQDALLSFRGVKRRQDVVGESRGILVIDDFAHHPTAVHETIHAMRLFHPDRRIIAAFEPRSNSSRRCIFQDDYAAAFDHADCVCIKEPPGMEAIPPEERLDAKRLVQEINRRQKNAHYFAASVELLGFLKDFCSQGDLVLCMSNGSFDGLPHRFFEILEDGPASQK